jgi:deoxyribodipyrimidine photo-lyase
VEVREYLQAQYSAETQRLEEFFRQLAWRDFFEKVLAWHGRGLDDNLEESKHGIPRSARIPLDVVQGETGLPCMDGILQMLFEEGYLHNHARLWFAAYLCHFRGIRWQEGARLFRQYLLDGDRASNSSSWQWVESTFASKPYFMNKQNIKSFSNGLWCTGCRVRCPFDADYPTLENRLFQRGQAPLAGNTGPSASRQGETASPAAPSLFVMTPSSGSITDLVWLHDAALSCEDPAIRATPGAGMVFVFDEPELLQEPWAKHRIQFVLDGLEDLSQNAPDRAFWIGVGDPATVIRDIAWSQSVRSIHVSEHPNPWVPETVHTLQQDFPVTVHARPEFAVYTQEPRRFSRYWQQVAEEVLGYRPKTGKRWHQ